MKRVIIFDGMVYDHRLIYMTLNKSCDPSPVFNGNMRSSAFRDCLETNKRQEVIGKYIK